MRASFDNAFIIVVGLEGHFSNDLDDPGNINLNGTPGFTIWGLSSRYNPGLTENTTIEEAKNIYLYNYWIPAGCDTSVFPLDICIFDAAVNPQNDPNLPGGSMQELMNQNPENWQDYLFFRLHRYRRCSKPKFRNGHINRVLKLHEQIKAIK